MHELLRSNDAVLISFAESILQEAGIGTLVADASAAKLDVELGWAGSYRNMRWSPVFVTASDSKPRNVIVELYAPHDTLQSMTIRQMLTIGPTPTTVAPVFPIALKRWAVWMPGTERSFRR